jgi:phosphate transport system substrate-binding protein
MVEKHNAGKKKNQEEMKMKKLIVVLAAVLLVAGSAMAWDWPWAGKNANKISIEGSTTVLPIAQKAAEDFMKMHRDIDVSVRGGGSGVGITSLMAGTCDIGDASRAIKTKEIVAAKQKGVNPVGNEIAKDGMAIIVNSSNPVKNLTINQLQDIYSGKIKKWSQLGGPDSVIVCVSRDSSSGTYEVFNELVLRGKKLRDDAIMTVSNREVAENVKNTPGAIGYVGLAFLSPELNTVMVEKIEATEANVVNGTYKLARPLYMYTSGEPAGLVKEFIDFIMSAEGQKIVKEVGYVPVK